MTKEETKQTVEEAAIEARMASAETLTTYGTHTSLDDFEYLSHDEIAEAAFVKGAEWQSKQPPWISVKERLPEEGQRVVFILEWRGIHRGYFAGLYKKRKWETEERVYDTISFHGIVIYYMPIPSFDEILEANRDVLERIKEKGD
jgi:hypothetical protein